MSDEMKKWECTGCGDGGEGPCTSFWVDSPHGCPYGTDENMKWEVVPQSSGAPAEQSGEAPRQQAKGKLFRPLADPL